MDFIEKLAKNYLPLVQANTISTYINPYQYYILRKIPGIDEKIDLFFFDGLLIPFCLRFIGYPKYPVMPPDLSGFFKRLFIEASDLNKSIYFIGSTQSEIETATNRIQSSFRNLNIVGFRNGFIDKNEYHSVLRSIVELKPDYVIVGMGVPNQEFFLINLKSTGFTGCGITCGGFFHQTAKGNIDYYPSLIKKLKIRWIYRIIDEPKLIYRYFVIYPIAMLTLLKDLIMNKFFNQ